MIPAIPYIRLVKMFAAARGLRCMKIDEIMKVARIYNEYCQTLN